MPFLLLLTAAVLTISTVLAIGLGNPWILAVTGPLFAAAFWRSLQNTSDGDNTDYGIPIEYASRGAAIGMIVAGGFPSLLHVLNPGEDDALITAVGLMMIGGIFLGTIGTVIGGIIGYLAGKEEEKTREGG